MSNIFIIGPRGSGKSTLAKALAQQLGLPALETSEALAQRFVAYSLGAFNAPGDIAAVTKRFLTAEKDARRNQFIRFGTMQTELKPSVYVDDCIKAGARIIVGVRRAAEFSGSPTDNDVLVECVRRALPAGEDHYEGVALRAKAPAFAARTLVDLATEPLEQAAARVAGLFRAAESQVVPF